MIRVAIMHYHLQPGGVARVIGNHLQALDAVSDEAIEVLVLHGPGTATAPNEEWQSFERVRVQRREIAGLDYDSRHQVDDLALRREIESVLADAGFTPDNALLHIHNHALGKNAALTACVGTMADARWPMLLQVHDFCEDFRPSEYVHLRTRCPDTAWWYPQADQIHYAVLNRRDYRHLSEAGVAETRLSVLPNPVLPLGSVPERETARAHVAETLGLSALPRYVLYPVRAIARKNIGEFLLHAALSQGERLFAVSLRPQNTREEGLYQRWMEQAEALGLPCEFEVGNRGVDFADNMYAADAILSTSVAEGFGMAYLESAQIGHAIIGRDLPQITADFRKQGLQFPGLRSRLQVPLEWVGADEWRDLILREYRRVLEAFRLEVPDDDTLIGQFNERIDDGWVDFATLHTDLQELVLQRVVADPAAAEALRQRNDLQEIVVIDEDLRERNRRMVAKHYGIETIGTLLLERYRQILAAPHQAASPLTRPQALVRGFADPLEFFPVRVARL